MSAALPAIYDAMIQARWMARRGRFEFELRRAIASGQLTGAALDVIADELAGCTPFADLPQVFVTLHLGGASRGSTARKVERSAANICRFLAGEPIHDPIPGLTQRRLTRIIHRAGDLVGGIDNGRDGV